MRDYQREHQVVLDEAMKIYIDKSRVRGQLWETMPPSDKIRELDERVKRLQVGYKAMEAEVVKPANSSIASILVADAVDIINYATFFVRQVRSGVRG